MAREKKSGKEEVLDNQDGSKNLLNSLLKGYKDDHYNGVRNKIYDISSGSLTMDSYIKVKSGQILKVGGSAEVGKTSQALLFAKNYMLTVPKSKTIYIDAESKFGPEIQKRANMTFTESADNWDENSVFIFRSNIFDAICNTLIGLLKQMYESGEHLCIILDSIDMLVLKSSLDNDISSGKKPAGVNFLTKELFRRIGPQINSYNSLFICITQYSSTFSLDPYSKAPPQLMEGNQTNALNHQASYALYYRQRFAGDYILEKEKEKPDPVNNKILGVNVKIEIKKSASDNSGQTIVVPIKKGDVSKVWVSKECGDLILAWELAKRAGAWITFSENTRVEAKKDGLEIVEKLQGINGLYDYLETNTAICDWFYKRFKEMLV